MNVGQIRRELGWRQEEDKDSLEDDDDNGESTSTVEYYSSNLISSRNQTINCIKIAQHT
jgi:hypothetical protein